MDDTTPIVTKNDEFQYRDKTKTIALFGIFEAVSILMSRTKTTMIPSGNFLLHKNFD